MGKELGTLLSVRDQKFADAILLGASAEKAAIAAGSPVTSARTTGPRMLRKAAVQDYIRAQQAKQAAKTLSRRERIEQELERMAFSNIEKFTRIDEDGRRVVDFSNATTEDLAAITTIKTKTRHIYTPKGEHIGTEHQDQFTLADKYRGLELLGKLDGMFKDEQTIVIDVANRLLQARSRLRNITPTGDDSEE